MALVGNEWRYCRDDLCCHCASSCEIKRLIF
jgi:hypothetical protein